MVSSWAWETLDGALASLGVTDREVEKRGNTVRFAAVEGAPTLVTIEKAASGLDLFGLVRVEITSMAADGLDFGDAAQQLLELNATCALGRWVWFADRAVGRTCAFTGTQESLRFLDSMLPGVISLSAADAVRANRLTEGRWNPASVPSGGVWSQSEAVQWLYTLVAHPPVALPLSQVARQEYEGFLHSGEDVWFSAGGEFSIAETPFADFDDDGGNPRLEPALMARFGGEGEASLETVLARFNNGVENPAYGKGPMVGVSLPAPLPEPYDWTGFQLLHTLSADQILQELGAWSIDFVERGPIPKYASFVPSAVVAALDEVEQMALAKILVRDALSQVRFAARVYEAMDVEVDGQDLRPYVTGRLKGHRASNERLLRGGTAAPDVGAEAVAYLTDDMLQVDDEWSVRDHRKVAWLPHHQMQSISSEPIGADDARAAHVLQLETTVASSSPADDATWSRINDFNGESCLASLVRHEDGTVVLRTRSTIHLENAWWLRQWFADLAVLHVAASKDSAEAATNGRLPGWTSNAYEFAGSGPRTEPDAIIRAIDVLREHSFNNRHNFREELYPAVEERLGTAAVNRSVTSPATSTQAASWSIEIHPNPSSAMLVAELEEASHSYLGPSLRVALRPKVSQETSPEEAARHNLSMWDSEVGMWMPMVCLPDGSLASMTLLPASLTRGFGIEETAGLLLNLILAGSRSLLHVLDGSEGEGQTEK